MIKVAILENQSAVEEDDNLYDKVSELLKAKHDKFKHGDSEALIFREEDQNEIEEYFGLKLDRIDDITDYIYHFSEGDYLNFQNFSIEKRECIKLVEENISQYEERIWNAEKWDREIEKIIKEQMYKIVTKIMSECFNIIDNGNFEWE